MTILFLSLLFVSSLVSTAARGAPPLGHLAAFAPDEPTPTRVFRELSKKTEPGLPQSTVMSMMQDREGVLWLATLDGLGVFDGIEVKSIPPLPHAPVHGAVYSLTPRRAGGLFAGADRTIYAFDGESWTEISAPGQSFYVIEDDDGSLLRLDGGKTFLRSTATGEWWPIALTGLGGDAEAVLGTGVEARRGPAGDLWLAGRLGVARRLDGEWIRVAGGAEISSPISSLLPMSDGRCLVGTLDGSLWLAEAGVSGWTRVEMPSWQGGWIRTLEEDRRGRVWAGGNMGGIAFGHIGGEWSVWGLEHGVPRGGILDIFADREGSLWFAINGRGAYQWFGEQWSHRNSWGSDRLDPRVQTFGIRPTWDGKGFLAAVFGRGVWRWDGEHLFEIDQEGFEDARIALEPEEDVLWIGSRFGAWESRGGGPPRQMFSLESGFVWDFEPAPDGTWYAATSTAGIFRRQDGVWSAAEVLNHQLPDLAVRDLMWHDGQLWAGTMAGLVVFEEERRLELAGQELLPSAVNAVFADGDAVWVVGGGGAALWRPDGVRRFGEEDGLPGNTIYSVTRDLEGAIWLGGSSGVVRQKGSGWQRFRANDGLIEEECNHQALLSCPDGSVLVGTMASLARWDGAVKPLERPPLELSFTHPASRSFPAGDRSVRFVWRAPWLLPKKVEYRVRVPRLAEAWSTPRSERFLQLENLGPGRWTVEVAARFAGEEDWTAPILATVEIERRWWQTRFFALLVGVLALLSVVSVVRLRTRQLARRAARLEHSVEDAVAKIKVLRGLLPICSVCKKVRDDDGYWQQIERYIDEHSEAIFSHSLCPECLDDSYPEWSEKIAKAKDLPG